MYISQIKIRNFRSLKSVDLSLHPGKNVIIGKNNSGKSNIIKALDYVLGERFPTYLTIPNEDFHTEIMEGEKIECKSFTILVELKHNDNPRDFNEEELLKYSRNTGFIPLEIPIISNYTNDIDDAFHYSDEKYSNKDKKWGNSAEISSYIQTADTVSIFLKAVREDGGEITKYFGIVLGYGMTKYFIFAPSKNLRESLVTSAIIPAIRSPYSELRVNNYSWYGKMLKNHWLNQNPEKIEEISELNKQINSLANELFGSSLSSVTSQVSNSINASGVQIQLLPKDVREMYKAALVYVNDAGFETTLENKGTGTQSCVIISLFTHYCKMMHKSGSLLAIEEPECYLHPHARRSLSSTLDSFMVNEIKGKPDNQVILTTHSAEFIRGTVFENVVLIRKNKLGISECRAITDESRVTNYREKVEKIINSKNAEMFFADGVILVEGGEEHLIPLIAGLEREAEQADNPLDRYNISVVNVGGKSNFQIYMSLLDGLGIPYYVIADFDVISDGKTLLKLEDESVMWDFQDDKVNRKQCLVDLNAIIHKHLSTDKASIRKTILDPTSIDAQSLCALLEEACTSQTVSEDLVSLWEYLKQRHTKEKVNVPFLKERINLEEYCLLDEVLEKLFQDEHIYVLKKGELEDYYTAEAQLLHGGKEMKALSIADEVCVKGRYIEVFMDISEYRRVVKKMIEDVKSGF